MYMLDINFAKHRLHKKNIYLYKLCIVCKQFDIFISYKCVHDNTVFKANKRNLSLFFFKQNYVNFFKWLIYEILGH